MAMAMAEIIAVFGGIVLVMLLLVLIACKPWRFLSCFFRPRTIKVDDLERPLVQEDSEHLPSQGNEPVKKFTQEGTYEQGFPPSMPHLAQGDSLILEIGDQSEDILVGQTLRCPLLTSHCIEEQTHSRKEDPNHDLRFRPHDIKFQSISKDIPDQGSCLSLEVITGPARGLWHSVRSTDVSKLPLSLGRTSPSDVLLKDSEVSGKHAMISWNSDKLKWELSDMGSLNGTLLNGKAIHHPDSRRTWGEAKELVSGDVITLGTTSQISVQVTSLTQSEIPFGVGIALDPMSLRRGGKKLPMEDVCYYRWLFPGSDQFGVFGICDGHGGAIAAQSVSKILPEILASILSDSLRREKVLSQQDASDVLEDAFSRTEACLNHYYEGCTATVLLVWADGQGSFFAQCANVGDSACVMNINGRQIKMTEDHRITCYSERQRINETGDPLKDGDTRLFGLNLGRMLGDKFLKEQDARFSSKSYVSQVVCIGQGSEAFALLASDGLWDVISIKKANQLVLQAKERDFTDRKDSAEKIANFLLNEARTLRSKDNTSIIYVDFDTAFKTLCRYDS